MSIRLFQTEDLPDLFGINAAAVPGVSCETVGTLAHNIALSTALVAIAPACGRPVGFLTLIDPGTAAYDSPNLRWFEARQGREGGDLVYVDRIAVHPGQRGQGIGTALYTHAFDRFSDRGEIGCEVNIRPPNPVSERFHAALGFRKVGEQDLAGGDKAVGYWVRPLGGTLCR